MLNFIIEYWIQFAFGLLISVAGYLYRQIKKYRSKMNSLEKSLILLLKDNILELYQKIKDKDTISVDLKEKINQLYHEYKKFECCDIIQDIMLDLDKKRIE